MRLWTLMLLTPALLIAPSAEATHVAYPLAPGSGPVTAALSFLSTQQTGDGCIGDPMTTAWSVMAIASAGQDPDLWNAPGSGLSPVDCLERSSHRLRFLTDLERQLLAATAAGADPHAFGGLDLVAEVQAAFDGTQFGNPAFINDDAFAILGLRSAGVPAADAAIQSGAAYILGQQNFDGGWSFALGQVSTSDDTAAALMALSAAGVPVTDPHVQDALQYFDAQQLPDGGMPSLVHGGTASNTASDAWSMHALVLYGEDPNGPAWTTPAGFSLLDNLLSFQQPDGSFNWDGVQRVGPIWMTAYAVPALVAQPYPVNL